MGSRTVRTDRFGDIEVADDEVVSFPEGLPAFETVTEVVLLPVDEDGLFFWMQAITDPAIAFLALTPWPLFPDYDVDLPLLDQAELELEDAAEAIVLCLITSHDRPRRLTANLAGPVVINQRNRRGRQVILEADLPTQAALPEIPSA